MPNHLHYELRELPCGKVELMLVGDVGRTKLLFDDAQMLATTLVAAGFVIAGYVEAASDRESLATDIEEYLRERRRSA